MAKVDNKLANAKIAEHLLTEFSVVEAVQKQNPNSQNVNLDFASYGIVTNFKATDVQSKAMRSVYQPINVKTLFSTKEVKNKEPMDLLAIQILHYFEVYGCGQPGMFNLEKDYGTKFVGRFVACKSANDIASMIESVIYRNAPIKNVEAMKILALAYVNNLDINRVQNNELMALLFNSKKHILTDGDAAVRQIVYMTTGSTLLIKSEEVINEIRVNKQKVSEDFLERHAVVLANVFNRHKRILMALKSPHNKTTINKISKLSKTLHRPLHQSWVKSFVGNVLKNSSYDFSVLAKASNRDLYKFLNALMFETVRNTNVKSFVVRNGKVWHKVVPHTTSSEKLNAHRATSYVLAELKTRLSHLKGKTILLDENVDYGLPISRKQVAGKLPFGTEISIAGKISSGVHWKNEWGATDLDLSAVNEKGQRLGWGMGAFSQGDLKFSGDVTSAPNGAMEFMTSKKSSYGLFNNIFSGKAGSNADIVVGTSNKEQWINNIVVQERVTLESRGMIVGYVRAGEKDEPNRFVVYLGRLNNKAANFGERHPLIDQLDVGFWTVSALFDALGIEYTTDLPGEKPDVDLRYASLSYDKLEDLLLEKK